MTRVRATRTESALNRPATGRALVRLGGNEALGFGSDVMRKRVDISDVRIDPETERSTVERVMSALDRGRGGLMVTVNLDHVRRCRRDEKYRTLVAESELVVADGMPIVWASHVQGTPLPERVAGSNLIWTLCQACAKHNRSVYLLGGDPGAAEGAKTVLERTYPGLRVVGTSAPERGFEKDEAQMARIEADLRASGADLVFIALGSPKQEYLGQRLRAVMPRAWFVGCGISLGFVAGQVKRAPTGLQRVGLEWMHRLMQEPGRLARRYIIDGIPFGLALLAGAAWRRVSGHEAASQPAGAGAANEHNTILGTDRAGLADRGDWEVAEASPAAHVDEREAGESGKRVASGAVVSDSWVGSGGAASARPEPGGARR